MDSNPRFAKAEIGLERAEAFANAAAAEPDPARRSGLAEQVLALRPLLAKDPAVLEALCSALDPLAEEMAWAHELAAQLRVPEGS